jgi:hypothetical protein
MGNRGVLKNYHDNIFEPKCRIFIENEFELCRYTCVHIFELHRIKIFCFAKNHVCMYFYMCLIFANYIRIYTWIHIYI